MSDFDPTTLFGATLSDTARLLRRRFDQKLRNTGSTRAQWHAIFKISRHPGIKQAELAELLEVEPITLTRMLDRMGDGGWVERRPDPKDRRARLLYLTAKAEAALVPARLMAEEIYEEALAGLDEDDRAQLLLLLGRIRNNLSDRSSASTEPAAKGEQDE